VGAFGADGGGDAGADVAGGADVFGELGMDFAELGELVHGGLVDFFLGVEAGAHGPFVDEMEEGAGFVEADGFGVGQKIERDFRRDAAIEELVFCGPGVEHGAIVDFFGAGVGGEEHGSDVVGFARIGEGEKRARAGDHAMALVLTVGGVADFFGEGVIGVLEGAHHRGVDADVESFETVEIARGIEETVDGFGIGALRFREAGDGAVGFGHDADGVGGIVDELGSLAVELGIEFAGEGFAGGWLGHRVFPFGQFFERLGAETVEELGVDGFYLRNHFSDDGAGFAGRVGGRAHAPEAMEHYAGESVHHGGEGGDGQDVAGDFDGALFGGALDSLEALGVGHRADVPDVVEDVACVADQQSGEFAIIIPGAGDGAFVNFLAFFVEEKRNGRDEGLRAVEADVALALLLGIVEGVRVEEGPDELAADVFEAEFEMSVLVDGVMAAVESGGADVDALLVGDFLGADEAGGVAGACGGNRRIERVREGVAKSDARRGGFD